MNKESKTWSVYVLIASIFITIFGVFFIFISLIGNNTDIGMTAIAAVITVLAAAIYIITLKQTQRQTEQLQENLKLLLLTQLDLSGKGLTKLPPELFHVTKLINLEVLNLSGNQFATFPTEIFELPNLTQLDLSNNQLTALPPNIPQLTKLEILNLSDNRLSAIQPEIFALTSLTKLNLSSNHIAELPPNILQLKNLTELNLNNTQLTKLPEEVTQLTKLEKLYLEGCPLISPPAEIAQHGIEAVRSHFASLKEDVQPLNEVKVILVGDGAAGKTSLVKRLLSLSFDECENTTHGISIRGWEIESASQRIKVNLWDFGGQEIMHATHQFFLSKRSLYILVIDGRRDERPEYWLRHIEAFGGDSPVLVVLNKYDMNPSFDINRPFLLEKYPSIRGFLHTSCKTGEGIAEFRKALLDELAKVEMIGISWPKSWFNVKRKLEAMDKPYISAEEYGTISKKAGIVDEQSQEILVDFLHDLGVVVHFRDFILDAMHVLDPVWVTNAVYKIITSEKLADSRGFLHLKTLGEILTFYGDDKFSCPPETHTYIMHLMQKFELCYPIGEVAVLIPQLLHVVEPSFAFDYDSSLRFAIYYPDFLPPSVFPRFIVKVHEDIKNNLCWRTGLMLQDTKSGTQALVKADIEARRINIWLQGERRREYLHYLRYILADINSSFEKLHVSERVSMPDEPHISADYETLIQFAGHGIDRYVPEGSKKMYSVHELLNMVEPKNKEELFELAEKIGVEPDEKASYLDMVTSLIEIRLMPPFININLSELFKRIMIYEKQKRQSSRK